MPTTRALSLVATGEPVVRDMFYDGNPRAEPGAVVCRVAPSFLRFGNFQILAAQGEHEALRRLADYTCGNFFPGLGIEDAFREICRRTGLLMADWMRLGFVHGVMNTDNLSVLGLTIDYGPYGWLEGYDLAWTPNTTDAEGRRYCYGNQPHIAQWNLARLAEALLPLVPEKEKLEDALALYADTFSAAWRKALAQKLGLAALDQPGDDALVSELFELLAAAETDFTIFFRRLAVPTMDSLLPAYYAADIPRERLAAWLTKYAARIEERFGAPGPHARRQPEIRVPQLPRAAGDRRAGKRRRLGARAPDAGPAPSLRRAAGARGARGAAPGMGAPPGRLLRPFLQFLSPAAHLPALACTRLAMHFSAIGL